MDRQEEIFPLEDLDYLLVGRDTARDLSFFDPLVEELHAELTKSEKDGKIVWSVKRVSSSRPMWVDGALQDETTLSVGSQIVVGPYTLTLKQTRMNINFELLKHEIYQAVSSIFKKKNWRSRFAFGYFFHDFFWRSHNFHWSIRCWKNNPTQCYKWCCSC